MTNGARIFEKSAWNFEIVPERCSYVFNYFLADMFINILGFIKVLPLDFLITDHTRSETPIFFFQNGLFPRLKGTFSWQKSGDRWPIIQIRDKRITVLGFLKTFQRQDIAFNMWKIVKKKIKMLNCCPKSEKCSISAQKSRKCLRELEM